MHYAAMNGFLGTTVPVMKDLIREYGYTPPEGMPNLEIDVTWYLTVGTLPDTSSEEWALYWSRRHPSGGPRIRTHLDKETLDEFVGDIDAETHKAATEEIKNTEQAVSSAEAKHKKVKSRKIDILKERFKKSST